MKEKEEEIKKDDIVDLDIGATAKEEPDKKVEKLKPAYSLGENVSFYLPKSLEVNRGEIVGFFLVLDEGSDDKGNYYYQLKYYKEMKDNLTKMFLGTVTNEEMGRDENRIAKRFKSIRISRIDEAIKQGKVELEDAKTNTDFHTGVQKELESELIRLEKLKQK